MGQEAAAPLSLASIGFTMAGDIEKAQGTKSADEYQAARAENAAAYARTAAAQTGAQLREKLNINLGNIQAVRAASGVDPSSPTTAALRGETEYYGDRTRNIQVDNLLAQANQDSADAAYLHSAGSFALKMGYLTAAGDALKAGAGTNPSTFGFPSPGG